MEEQLHALSCRRAAAGHQRNRARARAAPLEPIAEVATEVVTGEEDNTWRAANVVVG